MTGLQWNPMAWESKCRVVSSNVCLRPNTHSVTSDFRQLRLPGPDGARCFDFGTPYEEITRTLKEEAQAHYSKVGVLELALRATNTKPAPQRWQDAPTSDLNRLNVVIVFETRLFEATILGRFLLRLKELHGTFS